MPAGIAVSVEDGVATVEFVDSSLRGTSLADLFVAVEAAGLDPGVVVKRTRPLSYSAPESVVRAAGLLDDDTTPVKADEPVEEKPTYDDGLPDMDWSRKAIDDFASKLEPALDTTDEKNKPDAIDAIKNAIKAGATTPKQDG